MSSQSPPPYRPELWPSPSASAATASNFGNETRESLGVGELQTTVKEGMTLIDRFLNGGNRARPAALDILVVVLDGVVRRMRQQYSTRIRGINEGTAEIAQLDSNIARIKPKQEKLVVCPFPGCGKSFVESTGMRRHYCWYMAVVIIAGTGTGSPNIFVRIITLSRPTSEDMGIVSG